jgi:hypothetical protein
MWIQRYNALCDDNTPGRLRPLLSFTPQHPAVELPPSSPAAAHTRRGRAARGGTEREEDREQGCGGWLAGAGVARRREVEEGEGAWGLARG